MKEHKTILLFIFGVLFASVLPLVDGMVENNSEQTYCKRE